MAKNWGTITWLGDTGSPPSNLSVSLIPLCTGTASLANFMSAMQGRTLCKYKMLTVCWSTCYEQGAPAAAANVDKKAIIFFRNPTTLQVESFCYPAPLPDDLEETATGWRIKDSVVATITGYINTMTDRSYIPLYGKYLQRPE